MPRRREPDAGTGAATDARTDAALPLTAGLRSAWEPPRRATRRGGPGLTLARVVDAAVEVADTEGLAAVSMARVAARLGTAPMALYRHVGSKDELLVLMADVAIGPPPDPTGEWRRGLTAWVGAFREALRRRPWVLGVAITGPPITPNQIRWLDAGLRELRDTGLSWGERLSAIVLVAGFVRTDALQSPGAPTAADVTRARRAYVATLKELIDPYRLPEVDALLNSGDLEGPDRPDAEYAFGLDRILDGIADLITSRG